MPNSNDRGSSGALSALNDRIDRLPLNHRYKIETAIDCILDGFSFSATDRDDPKVDAHFCGLEWGDCIYQNLGIVVRINSLERDFYLCSRELSKDLPGIKKNIVDLYL